MEYIEVIDYDLQTTLEPLLFKYRNTGQLKDVALRNEGVCLKVVIRAFSVYPPNFIKSLISRVAIAETIIAWSILVGGFNFDNIIAISCHDVHGEGTTSANLLQNWKIDNIHAFIAHTVLFKCNWLFHNDEWEAFNLPDFHYGDMEDHKNL